MSDAPVSDIQTLLMACQFGDGQFPSGAFGFSWGLEGLVTDGLVARGDLVPFILGQVEGRWAGFDRVFVAHAHDGAGDEAASTSEEEQEGGGGMKMQPLPVKIACGMPSGSRPSSARASSIDLMPMRT